MLHPSYWTDHTGRSLFKCQGKNVRQLSSPDGKVWWGERRNGVEAPMRCTVILRTGAGLFQVIKMNVKSPLEPTQETGMAIQYLTIC